MMAGKALRKASSPHNPTPDRWGPRARPALPAAGASVPVTSPVVIRDPGVEDQRFRTCAICPSYSEPEAVTECALQLRKIGDKLDLRQRILNLVAKLFCPGTQECLE